MRRRQKSSRGRDLASLYGINWDRVERLLHFQLNRNMRPIECPLNRMALSSRGPTRSMEYVRGCRALTGDQSSVLPNGPHGDWADEPLRRIASSSGRASWSPIGCPRTQVPPSGELLDHHRVWRRSSLQSRGFFPALFVGRALPRGDLVERAPLGFHPHVGVPNAGQKTDVRGWC